MLYRKPLRRLYSVLRLTVVLDIPTSRRFVCMSVSVVISLGVVSSQRQTKRLGSTHRLLSQVKIVTEGLNHIWGFQFPGVVQTQSCPTFLWFHGHRDRGYKTKVALRIRNHLCSIPSISTVSFCRVGALGGLRETLSGVSSERFP